MIFKLKNKIKTNSAEYHAVKRKSVEFVMQMYHRGLIAYPSAVDSILDIIQHLEEINEKN